DRQFLLIDYLREENRVLREQLGEKRLRFTDDQRRRLAAKAKGLGRKVLVELGTAGAGSPLYSGEYYSRGLAKKGPHRTIGFGRSWFQDWITAEADRGRTNLPS